MANAKISQLTANTNPTGNEELVYAYNNTNGKMTLDTMKTFAGIGKQDTLVSGTNIKTINNNSLLGSGNITISGGEGPTELSADANIWELTEGIYVTSHDLYYKSGSAVPVFKDPGVTYRQMLFVTSGATNQNAYFVFNEGYLNNNVVFSYAAFGYSVSSSKGNCKELNDYRWTLNKYEPFEVTDSIYNLYYGITQIVSEANGTSELDGGDMFPGVTYTVYIESVKSGYNYSVILGTGITNPFNITLPTNSTKKCLITVLATSASDGIVTGCTIAS